MEKNIQEQPQKTVKDFISKSISLMRSKMTKSKNPDKTQDTLQDKSDTVSTAQTKKEIDAIKKEDAYADMQLFKTVLGKDKNYMDAIDILQVYDKKLSINPNPADVSVTRQMFSAIVQKAGYDTAAEYLYPELETRNLNRLFGMDKQGIPEGLQTEKIHVPGLEETEIKKHLVDIAEIEKASLLSAIRNKEEWHNVHLAEHDWQVHAEGKTEFQYQQETDNLSKEIDESHKSLNSKIKSLDEFITQMVPSGVVLETNQPLETNRHRDILDNLQKLNVDIEPLKQSNVLQELLAGKKTSHLIDLSLSLGNSQVNFKARLSVNPVDNTVLVYPQRNLEEQINAGFKGYAFSEEEKGNLMALGSAGKVISIQQKDGTSEKYLVGTDNLTNELVTIRQKDVTIKDEFGGVKLTQQKKEELLSGHPVFLEGIRKGALECSSLVQYSVEKGRLEMLQYGLNISSIENVKLQKEQQELLKEGKTVLISGLFDGKDVKYNAWVRLDMKNMMLMKSKEVPEKEVSIKNEITPSIDHRVQVSQNTKGIKTEENKFASSPLLSAKQRPSAGSEERKRNKGHKM